MESLQPLDFWFRASYDDSHIQLDVEAPGRASRKERIRWSSIDRVCFKTGDLYTSDEIHVFTAERPESYLIPTEAKGAVELWEEILRKGLFDAKTSIRAMQTTNELFCWPPVD